MPLRTRLMDLGTNALLACSGVRFITGFDASELTNVNDSGFLTVPMYSLFLSLRNHFPYKRKELVCDSIIL